TLWVEHEVQPLAREMFGQEVVRLGDMGTYDCRNIVGNPLWKRLRSQHAAANAIDSSGFTFADGRSLTLLRDWRGRGRDRGRLRDGPRSWCRYLRVGRGPECNGAHETHVPFARGLRCACK